MVGSVSDNKGNNWTRAYRYSTTLSGNPVFIEIWWHYFAAAQTGVILTNNMSGPAPDYLTLDVFAVTGVLNPSAPWDTNPAQTNGSQGTSAAPSIPSRSSNATYGIDFAALIGLDYGSAADSHAMSTAGYTLVGINDQGSNGSGCIGDTYYRVLTSKMAALTTTWTGTGGAGGWITYGAVLNGDPAYDPNTVTVVADSGSPYMEIYRGVLQEVKLGAPTAAPGTSGSYGIDVSPNGKYVAVGSVGTSKAVSIYDITTTPPTLAFQTDFAAGGAFQVAFSPDSKYVAFADSGTPFLAVYAVGTWTKLSNPATLPSSYTQSITWNAQSTLVVVGDQVGQKNLFYSISGTTLVLQGSMATNSQGSQSLKFSADGTVLVSAIPGAGGWESWAVTSNGTVFTKNPNPTGGVQATDVAINPAKTLVAVACNASPFLQVFNYPAMTLRTAPAVLPAARVWGVTFSADGSEIICVGSGIGFTVYDVATMTQTLRSGPASTVTAPAVNQRLTVPPVVPTGVIITTLTQPSIKTLTGNVGSTPPNGKITTNLTRLAISATGKQTMAGTIRTALAPVSMSLAGTDLPRITGTMTTALSSVSMALAGTDLPRITGAMTTTLMRPTQLLAATTVAARGTIHTNLPRANMLAQGKADVRGLIATLLRPANMALIGKTDVRGAILSSLKPINISAAGLHIITGALRTDLFPNGLQMTVTARAFEIFTGSITTRLTTLNFRQELQALEIEQGTIVTKLGNAGQFVSSAVKAEQRIIGPIVTELQPLHSSLLGAKLGAAGDGKWYSWRYRDS